MKVNESLMLFGSTTAHDPTGASRALWAKVEVPRCNEQTQINEDEHLGTNGRFVEK